MTPDEGAEHDLRSRSYGLDFPSHTPFEEPWWLEAVAPGRWGAVTVEHDGATVGRLPFVVASRFGYRALIQPPLVPYLGPWAHSGGGTLQRRLATEKDLLDQLLAWLPPTVSHRAAFAPEAGNGLPFFWRGYETAARYTYRISAGQHSDDVWSGMLKDVRKKVRRAQRTLTVARDVELAAALDLHRRIFVRQGLTAPFGDDIAVRLDRACVAHGSRDVSGAVDRDGRLHAMLYTVHDDRWTYLLFGGPEPELATSGAYPLVVWTAIRDALDAGRGVDFLGSMMERVERHNRSFGAERVPYLSVSRETSGIRWLRATRAVVRDGARWGSRRLFRGAVDR